MRAVMVMIKNVTSTDGDAYHEWCPCRVARKCQVRRADNRFGFILKRHFWLVPLLYLDLQWDILCRSFYESAFVTGVVLRWSCCLFRLVFPFQKRLLSEAQRQKQLHVLLDQKRNILQVCGSLAGMHQSWQTMNSVPTAYAHFDCSRCNSIPKIIWRISNRLV